MDASLMVCSHAADEKAVFNKTSAVVVLLDDKKTAAFGLFRSTYGLFSGLLQTDV